MIINYITSYYSLTSMFPMLGLRTTIYQVPDLAAAKEWYAKAFAKVPYFDEPFYVGFNIGGFELGLLPAEKATTGQPDNVLSYWGVESVEDIEAK